MTPARGERGNHSTPIRSWGEVDCRTSFLFLSPPGDKVPWSPWSYFRFSSGPSLTQMPPEARGGAVFELSMLLQVGLQSL